MAAKEAAAEESAAPSGRRKTLMVGGIMGAIMLFEGVGVFVMVKHFGKGPASAEASMVNGLDPTDGVKTDTEVEVPVVQMRAQNDRSSRVRTFDLTVYAVVPKSRAEECGQLIEQRQQTIKDRFSSIVRAADPQRFSEPDLATLRDQFRHELVKILGDEEMLERVLIPNVVAFTDG